MTTRKQEVGATIWDVAKQSGVSIATVSHVVNNGPRAVRPDTRERVTRAIRELNYHPNAMARGLISRRMNTIGVLSGVFTAQEAVVNPYASGILEGVIKASAAAGYDVLLFTEGWKDLEKSGPIYRDRRADGVLAISPTTESDMISGLVSLNLAVVSVAADCLELDVPSVDVDNRKGAELATRHLLSLGHRRIAHIMGSANMLSVVQRRETFLRVLLEAGITPSEGYLQHALYRGDHAYDHTIDLLKRPDPPTAIFAGNDMIALGALQAARDLGVNVPGQLSIVGFDNSPAIEHVSPALTTIRQPLGAIGELATHLLIQRMTVGPMEARIHLIEPELLLRETTAPAPSG